MTVRKFCEVAVVVLTASERIIFPETVALRASVSTAMGNTTLQFVREDPIRGKIPV